MPRLKRQQAALLQRLVLVGMPGETASIIGAACYDQNHLSPRFFGPKVSENEAQRLVEDWLANHQPGPEYTEADRAAVNQLVESIFG